ncbi:MAG: DUF4351 domain-containing protein, partial [Lautropia sp.]|nr:DUF4351 domain-containing protein [Lautropia sp.]
GTDRVSGDGASDNPQPGSSGQPGEPPSRRISHDQNFKNLILDYPREALLFYAEAEAKKIDPSARITPIRQEQLKDRLGDRFFELDVPLLVEWPDGSREAIIFVIEEETDPARFSPLRLGSYCMSVAELMKTNQIVPEVIFLKPGPTPPTSLTLGSPERPYLHFEYIVFNLAQTPARLHFESSNIVARLNLVAMQHSRTERPIVYGQALKGLLTLEPSTDRQRKYLDFIDMYLPLEDNEREEFERNYQTESRNMGGIVSRAIEQGMQAGRMEGLQEGLQTGRFEGQTEMLTRQLQRRFGPLSSEIKARLQAGTSEDLTRWADNFVDAKRIEDVFQTH